MTYYQRREAQILAEVRAQGITTGNMVCSSLNNQGEVVRKMIAELIRRGEIVELGTAGELGIKAKKCSLMMIAIKGTQKPLKEAPQQGQKATPRSVTWQPLNRDIFAFWRMCARDPYTGVD